MMQDAVKDMRALRAFCDPESKPRDKMATVKHMNDLLSESNLPEDQKTQIGAKLDDGLAEYLVREKGDRTD